MHDIDPVFNEFSYNSDLYKIINPIIPNPSIIQSMYIFKNSEIGSKVSPHMDGSFLLTENPNYNIGVWIALDIANQKNGCLYVVPGSHKIYDFDRRLVRKENKLELKTYENKEWDLTTAIPLIANKGDIVIMHSKLIHFSEPNTSKKPRNAYTLHIVDISEIDNWSEDNWIQRSSKLPFKQWDYKN